MVEGGRHERIFEFFYFVIFGIWQSWIFGFLNIWILGFKIFWIVFCWFYFCVLDFFEFWNLGIVLLLFWIFWIFVFSLFLDYGTFEFYFENLNFFLFLYFLNFGFFDFWIFKFCNLGFLDDLLFFFFFNFAIFLILDFCNNLSFSSIIELLVKCISNYCYGPACSFAWKIRCVSDIVRIDSVEHEIEPCLFATTSFNFPLSRSGPILKQNHTKINWFLLTCIYCIHLITIIV